MNGQSCKKKINDDKYFDTDGAGAHYICFYEYNKKVQSV
jgi:hypothetical protein